MTQTITSMRKKEKRTKEAKRFDRIQNGSNGVELDLFLILQVYKEFSEILFKSVKAILSGIPIEGVT